MEDNPVTGIAMCIPQLEPKPIGCPVDRATFQRMGRLLLANAEAVLFGDVVYNCEHYTVGQFMDTFGDEFIEELNLVASYMEKLNQKLSAQTGDAIPENLSVNVDKEE